MNNKNKTTDSVQSTGLAGVAGYAYSIRRWNFSTHGSEIWVCEGDHEKSESCCNNEREVGSVEAVRIIEQLRDECLRLYQHNTKISHAEDAASNRGGA